MKKVRLNKRILIPITMYAIGLVKYEESSRFVITRAGFFGLKVLLVIRSLLCECVEYIFQTVLNYLQLVEVVTF